MATGNGSPNSLKQQKDYFYESQQYIYEQSMPLKHLWVPTFSQSFFIEVDFITVLYYKSRSGLQEGLAMHLDFFFAFSNSLDERNGKMPMEQNIFNFLYVWDSLVTGGA